LPRGLQDKARYILNWLKILLAQFYHLSLDIISKYLVRRQQEASAPSQIPEMVILESEEPIYHFTQASLDAESAKSYLLRDQSPVARTSRRLKSQKNAINRQLKGTTNGQLKALALLLWEEICLSMSTSMCICKSPKDHPRSVCKHRFASSSQLILWYLGLQMVDPYKKTNDEFADALFRGRKDNSWRPDPLITPSARSVSDCRDTRSAVV